MYAFEPWIGEIGLLDYLCEDVQPLDKRVLDRSNLFRKKNASRESLFDWEIELWKYYGFDMRNLSEDENRENIMNLGDLCIRNLSVQTNVHNRPI